MPQAQRVADLVHHHVLQGVGDEAFGLRAIDHLQLAAQLQQFKAEHRFLQRIVRVAALLQTLGKLARQDACVG